MIANLATLQNWNNNNHKWVSHIMQYKNEIALQSNTKSTKIGYWKDSSS
jgi:hypothetical protein